MIKTLRHSLLALVASSALFSANLYAEPGDYGFWETLGNLVSPAQPTTRSPPTRPAACIR
ncbi:hypothetical protein [Microbulbifer halophilus]|uniref:hypothetical protein n=1 Tax=Microbulbifer halophilus TaxID=453963 RepID=UPI00360D8CA8